MKYSDKLKYPKWQKKRLEIMGRDSFKCSNCNTDKIELQVHHLDYFPSLEPWEYPNDMLITLCEPCHSKELRRFKHENYLLKCLQHKGFLADDLVCLMGIINTNPRFVEFIKNQIKKYQNG